MSDIEIETTLTDIKLFIESLKSDMPEVFAKDKVKEDIAGKVLYMGDIYDAAINITPEEEPSVKFEDGKFIVKIKSEQDDAGALVETWLWNQAETVLKERTKIWAEKMGVEVNNVAIKDQRTMWGSASEKKNINYSYRIIKMPNVIINYLVIHEVAHLVHMNHADEYWSLVAVHCPEYNEHRKWLNGNRAYIMADTKLKYVKPQEKPVEAETDAEQPVDRESAQDRVSVEGANLQEESNEQI
ncbi:M48 family metallopeptidase [Elusimicrobium minutum]|uniref:M48 family metallopeptidase n=1 Tax=Elusimicrobium minutum TaxID=423605 RepID=UPI000161820F|nr:M48 family metallopeptidase [Elusimicrobium minutum]